jgi:hypothetical protein
MQLRRSSHGPKAKTATPLSLHNFSGTTAKCFCFCFQKRRHDGCMNEGLPASAKRHDRIALLDNEMRVRLKRIAAGNYRVEDPDRLFSRRARPSSWQGELPRDRRSSRHIGPSAPRASSHRPRKTCSRASMSTLPARSNTGLSAAPFSSSVTRALEHPDIVLRIDRHAADLPRGFSRRLRLAVTEPCANRERVMWRLPCRVGGPSLIAAIGLANAVLKRPPFAT